MRRLQLGNIDLQEQNGTSSLFCDCNATNVDINKINKSFDTSINLELSYTIYASPSNMGQWFKASPETLCFSQEKSETNKS